MADLSHLGVEVGPFALISPVVLVKDAGVTDHTHTLAGWLLGKQLTKCREDSRINVTNQLCSNLGHHTLNHCNLVASKLGERMRLAMQQASQSAEDRWGINGNDRSPPLRPSAEGSADGRKTDDKPRLEQPR